ncbi:dTDP-4-amino-4,6-dideoxygalactose transaminase [Bradyrhizobium lablabi]|uniref:dTDP-4-amino-4,6-dideoxygalactose transaminase n=1 Tax=Bradyrhizobium lablabi TaxID=722472 RepID=A0A1M7BFE7_9BRAD|nr:DegT/DnrJ/EryC1/StrS family aminotransferase [Bradyrhizobium lablabi]SHL53671.1 dTDP-4-amino-4,6-dideoxygalactose transaminase [Bradyrhizobium lablabi]
MTQARKIPFGKPWITEAERNAVLGVLAGDVLTHGPQAHEFEKEFAAALGNGHALTLSNGTAALHLAYWQLDIGAGDEVIVPAQTHVATVHAVEMVGARPVFVDCDRATGNMTPDAIEAAITPQTRAIGLVHFVGIPCDMPAIMTVASKRGLKVVEDCALALGTRWDGTHAGLFGDAGTFSFYPVKHITTGDGGMLVTRHEDLAKKISKARAFGIDRTFAERTVPGVYDVLSLGINYRLSDINSAIGREQLKRLDTILERRARNFSALKKGLAGLEHVAVLDVTAAGQTSSHYCLTAVFDGPLADKRTEIIRRLNAAGVGTSVYYPHPIPRLQYYREKYGADLARFPNAARISDQSIALPVGPHLEVDDMNYIANELTTIVRDLTCSKKN